MNRTCMIGVLALWAGTFLSAQPTPASLQWTLQRQADETIAWSGLLPPEAPSSRVEWRARAIWTSAADSSTTRLLADTGALLTTYYPRHRLTLSTLAPPPGEGAIELAFYDLPNQDPILAKAAVVSPPQASLAELLEMAEDALKALDAEILVASRYGVRRPESRALLELGRAYLGIARDMKSERARRDLGRWWMAWITPRAKAEKRTLETIRERPDLWTPLDDPPLWDVRFDGEQWRTALAMPDGEKLIDFQPVAIQGKISPEDAPRIKALGFNTIRPEIVTEELKRAAEQWNVMILGPAQENVFFSENVFTVTGWEPFDESTEQPLADVPWVLWRVAMMAMEARRSGRLPLAAEAEFKEKTPDLPIEGLESPPPGYFDF